MNADDKHSQPAEIDKAGADYLEYAAADTNTEGPDVVVSAYAALSTSQTVRKFWRLYLTGFAVAFSGT